MNTLVLCDDTDDVRDFLRREVANHPDLAVVGEAVNGEEAIAQAGSLQPDVMLLDVRMPVLDGLAALPRILEVSPNTKVAVFSGLDPDAARPMALAEGAAIFIEKGAPLSVVIEAVRGLCAPEAQPAREREALLLREHLEQRVQERTEGPS